MKIYGITASALLLSGCASIGLGPSSNTGQIDYRIAEPRAVTPQQVEASSDNGPIAPARLYRKYSGADNAFNSTPASEDQRDVFSIVLEQVIVGEFIGEPRFAQPAEIAVLANAFEFPADASGNENARFFEFPEFTGPTQAEDGTATAAGEAMKLIYFSPDVYLGQPLNFSALPIIPPSQYQGRPIGIQIVVLELDRLPGPVKSLLRELASLGRASNVASSVPGISDIALDLGSSMLSGNASNDDLVFEYRFVLYPEHLSSSSTGTSLRNETATFQPGRYVLRRYEDRDAQMPWDNLVLDHNTARLFQPCSAEERLTQTQRRSSASASLPAGTTPQGSADSGCYSEWRKDTYMVLNILKHAPGTPEAAFAFQTFSDFNEVMQEAADLQGQPLNVVRDALAEHVASARSTAWLTETSTKWTALKAALDNYDQLRFPGNADDALVTISQADRNTCRAGPAPVLNTQLIEAQLRVEQAAASFVTTFKQAIEVPTAGQGQESQSEAPFGDDDQVTLINRLALYAVPKNSDLRANFATSTVFQTQYVTGKNGAELSGDLLGALRRTPIEYSCEDLRARSWFEAITPPAP